MGKNQHRWRANCQCGQTAVEVIGAPILSAVCYCENCRAAGHAFERAEGAPRTVGPDGGVEYYLYRKDRVAVIRGGEYLQEHRLTPDSKVRRVVAPAGAATCSPSARSSASSLAKTSATRSPSA